MESRSTQLGAHRKRESPYLLILFESMGLVKFGPFELRLLDVAIKAGLYLSVRSKRPKRSIFFSIRYCAIDDQNLRAWELN